MLYKCSFSPCQSIRIVDVNAQAVMLVSQSDNTGEVEVNINGSWHKMCNASLTSSAANVACRQLQCSGGI